MKTLLAIIILFMPLLGNAQPTDASKKANTFLSTLNQEQQKRILFDFNDDERFNWHFVPMARKGLTFHDMNEKQRESALALLKASLNKSGFEKVTRIMGLENVLREVENRGVDDHYRDALQYYFSIFGTPSEEKNWGWRIEGHHVSFNFSVVDGLIESSTPSFLGSNPAIVREGKRKGEEILKLETDLGFQLINSLSTDQLKSAMIAADALPEILSSDKRKAETLEPKGIKYTSLNEQQRKLIMELLEVYVANYELGFSNKLRAKIKNAGVEKLSFAWAGATTPGIGHYYRIQGPMLLIEYDNTQNKANHVHSVVRDLTNDFGEDILREHYAKHHNEK